jgi:acetyl-CoA carboxylase biotin carboxyl carrier protein
MEIAELEQLVSMVRDSEVGELTIKHDGERVTIRKAARNAPPSVELVPSDPGYTYGSDFAEIVDTDAEEIADERPPVTLITAPLVGVFGHVKPLVGLHARVTEGQVVGIIEAMKINTEVRSPVSGTVVDLFIEDGHPVEYGQALFGIRSS